MSNNGFGSQVIFTVAGVSQSLVPGLVIGFDFEKQAQMVEKVDGNDNFININFPKQKRVANLDVLFTNSGSAFTLPPPGTSTAAFTVPWMSDVSGSYGVTKSRVKTDAEAYVTATFEITQWVTSTGTLP